MTSPEAGTLKILFASHTHFGDVLRVGSHHYARELSLVGHEVTHISTPVSLAHLVRSKDRAVRRRLQTAVFGPGNDSDGVRHAVPLTALPFGAMSRNARLRALRRFSRASNIATPDVILVDQPLFEPLLDLFPDSSVIYRPTDIHAGEEMRRAERLVAERASAIVATSQPVLDDVVESMRSERRVVTEKQFVLENGVEYDRFRGARQRGAEKRAGAVYVGAVDDRFDWRALSAMADAVPDEPIDVIGPVTFSPDTTLPRNVSLLGEKPYVEVPAILQRARVGLLPTSAVPRNRGRSPMKYYEYLAAGLNVVAAMTPSLVSRESPGVWLYRDADSAAVNYRTAMKAPPNASGQALAAQFSWGERAIALEGVIRGLCA